MSFKLNNPPFPRNTDLTKKNGLGPRVNKDATNLEAKEDAEGVGSGSNKKVMTTTKKFSSHNAVKSDAQKKVEARKKEVAAMSKEELAAEQKRLNERRKAFENSDEYKARTSSLPFIGNLKIEKVSKNSINIPNINKKNNTEAFMNAPYRDPNSTGPRVKRKGYHGWRKTNK